MTDPIADYLTRLRNAISAHHKVVNIPASNLKKEITKTLMDKGYILNYKFEDTKEPSEKVETEITKWLAIGLGISLLLILLGWLTFKIMKKRNITNAIKMGELLE